MIHSFAGGSITDTGPLTRKHIETIDEAVNVKALDFMERAKKTDKPFFLWWNSTRMHICTHLKPGSVGKTGLGSGPTAWSSTTAMSAMSARCWPS